MQTVVETVKLVTGDKNEPESSFHSINRPRPLINNIREFQYWNDRELATSNLKKKMRKNIRNFYFKSYQEKLNKTRKKKIIFPLVKLSRKYFYTDV